LFGLVLAAALLPHVSRLFQVGPVEGAMVLVLIYQLVLKHVYSPQNLVCLGYGMPDQWDLFIPIRNNVSGNKNLMQKKITLATLFVI
jgi:hypothetical protein